MPRIVTIAGAQLGPVQKADSRESVVARMIALMDQATAQGADFIVYPELALTTFFPRCYYEDRAEADRWFEWPDGVTVARGRVDERAVRRIDCAPGAVAMPGRVSCSARAVWDASRVAGAAGRPMAATRPKASAALA